MSLASPDGRLAGLVAGSCDLVQFSAQGFSRWPGVAFLAPPAGLDRAYPIGHMRRVEFLSGHGSAGKMPHRHPLTAPTGGIDRVPWPEHFRYRYVMGHAFFAELRAPTGL